MRDDTTMLRGKLVQLRPIRQTDLPTFITHYTDISNRGDYFPINIQSEAVLSRKFQETGFWSEESGLLLMMNQTDTIIGHIEFFKAVSYLDSYELSYLLYDRDARGQGITSEAVRLLTGYLFDTKKVNRIQLVIHPDNIASRRVAEKNGFSLEGMMCGAWYHRGQYHDVAVYTLLRPAYEARGRKDGA